jgi:hypothetical protein
LTNQTIASGFEEMRIPDQVQPDLSVDTKKQLDRWQAVYSGLGLECDVYSIAIPPRKHHFDRLIVVPEGLTLEALIDALEHYFHITFCDGRDLTEVKFKDDRDANGGKGSYAIWSHRRAEADQEYSGHSVLSLESDGVKGITLMERMLYDLIHFVETRHHLDGDGYTLCSGTKIIDEQGQISGQMPNVSWCHDNKCVEIDWVDESSSTLSLCIREVITQ